MNENQLALWEHIGVTNTKDWPAELVARRRKLCAEHITVHYFATVMTSILGDNGWRLIPGAPTSQYNWALMRLEHDPLFSDPRGFPMPGQLIERIKEDMSVGMCFDTVWIAHEVPRRVQQHHRLRVRDLLPEQKPTLLKNMTSALLDGAVGILASSVEGALDPILFGVNLGEGKEILVADLFVIGQWFYA